MAEITSGMLIVERAANGTWSVKPRTGRAYGTPVQFESIRRSYGGELLSNDFSGRFGESQRFQTSVRVVNTRGLSNMDGALQAMVDEVGIVNRFVFEWPQPLTDATVPTAARLSANAAVGANSVRMRAGDAVPVGRLVQFESGGKLHRVVSAPEGRQTAVWSMGIFPSLTKAAAGGTTVELTAESMVRLQAPPQLVVNRGIVLETTFVVREAVA